MSDDMENNLSTFHTEMKECSYILDKVTPKSLVIIDELGRGTSNTEGFAIAMAVAEALIDTDAYCFFATHFMNLVSLEEMYPTVRNIHMNGDTAPQEQHNLVSSDRMQFIHKLGTGPCRLDSGYGIAMAEKCGFPESLIVNAVQFSEQFKRLHLVVCEPGGINRNIPVLNSLLDNLLILKNSTLSTDGLRTYLQGLQSKMTPSQFATLKAVVTEMYNDAISREQITSVTVPRIVSEMHSKVQTLSQISVSSESIAKTIYDTPTSDACSDVDSPVFKRQKLAGVSSHKEGSSCAASERENIPPIVNEAETDIDIAIASSSSCTKVADKCGISVDAAGSPTEMHFKASTYSAVRVSQDVLEICAPPLDDIDQKIIQRSRADKNHHVAAKDPEEEETSTEDNALLILNESVDDFVIDAADFLC